VINGHERLANAEERAVVARIAPFTLAAHAGNQSFHLDLALLREPRECAKLVHHQKMLPSAEDGKTQIVHVLHKGGGAFVANASVGTYHF